MAEENTQQTTTNFPQFGIVSDTCSDHHFVETNQKSFLSSSTSGPLHKKIMKEWKLLSKELPDSIYVRVYETRVDLLRAAIVGARGTPYHDGLFFFDVAFPADYPAKPPLVQYRSFGFRLNPNLYASGKVCLSLLHTWSGRTCELWNPNKSSILQVLLSIQALVLNEKPYFNEPGYGAFAGNSVAEKKSLAYSEAAFILSCKTMLCVLHKPPKNFEPLVKEHFVERAEFILNACDMYRKGLVRVGMFDGVVREGKGNVSSKFKGLIDRWLGDLAKAFARNGASVEYFVAQVANKKNESKTNTDVKKTRKVSMVEKLKNFFVGLIKKKTKTSPVLDNISQESVGQTVN